MGNAWIASALSQPGTRPQPERLLSLDVFRGITIASMILVNDPGSWEHVYRPLTHADWHGWTCTDLIFPCFLFIVGVAITFSLAKRKTRGEGRLRIYLRTVRRTVLLFTLGLFLTNFPYYTLATLRIPGVLQRIALCYVLAVFIFLTTEVWGQISLTIALLALYWVLMMLVPVPGYGAGVLEKEGNLAAYVDSLLLHGHLLHNTWDPEGLLSTIPALATTLLGIEAGHWLQAERSEEEKTLGLLAAGAAGMLIGQGMNLWFPINKNLWTSSYVVFSGGMALLFLGGCYWLVDSQRYRRLVTPFVVFGVNPITVYVLATLVARLLDMYWVVGPDGTVTAPKTDLYERGFAAWAGPTKGSLFFALTYVAFWLMPMSVLYRRRIFLKL